MQKKFEKNLEKTAPGRAINDAFPGRRCCSPRPRVGVLVVAGARGPGRVHAQPVHGNGERAARRDGGRPELGAGADHVRHAGRERTEGERCDREAAVRFGPDAESDRKGAGGDRGEARDQSGGQKADRVRSAAVDQVAGHETQLVRVRDEVRRARTGRRAVVQVREHHAAAHVPGPGVLDPGLRERAHGPVHRVQDPGRSGALRGQGGRVRPAGVVLPRVQR